MDQITPLPQFNAILRPEIHEEFIKVCKDHTEDFTKLFKLTKDISDFLKTKVGPNDNTSKEYYTTLFNFRIRDHFSSSMMLISQGFVVDAISLTRASLEDLLVLINFYIDQDYFNKWHQDDTTFKIEPYKLRDNIRNHNFFGTDDGDFFDGIYKSLSNIVHPKINSLRLMASYHPTFNTSSQSDMLEKYTQLVVMSFFTYEVLLCKFLKHVYPQDTVKLKEIVDDLFNNIKIKSSIELDFEAYDN